MEGKIEKIIGSRGFGFIVIEGEENNVFFHCSDVSNGKFDALKEGDSVSFDLEDGPKGKAAVKVTKMVIEEEEDPI